jgi:hypothetical protein
VSKFNKLYILSRRTWQLKKMVWRASKFNGLYISSRCTWQFQKQWFEKRQNSRDSIFGVDALGTFKKQWFEKRQNSRDSLF